MIDIFKMHELKKDKLAISCKTSQEATELFKYFRSIGFEWIGGTPMNPDDTHWDVYNTKTAYTPNVFKKLRYCDISYYNRNNYTIIKAVDVYTITITPEELFKEWMSEDTND